MPHVTPLPEFKHLLFGQTMATSVTIVTESRGCTRKTVDVEDDVISHQAEPDERREMKRWLCFYQDNLSSSRLSSHHGSM